MMLGLSLAGRRSGSGILSVQAAVDILSGLGASSWYDARDIVTGDEQYLLDRLDPGNAAKRATRGASTDVESVDPAFLPSAVTGGRPVSRFDGAGSKRLTLPTSEAPTFTATTGQDGVLVLYRNDGNTNLGALWSSAFGASFRGWTLYLSGGISPTARVRDDAGTTVTWAVTGGTDANDGELRTIGSVVNDGSMQPYSHETGFNTPQSIAALGTITHISNPQVGATLSAFVFSGDVLAVVRFKGAAPSEADLDVASALLKGAYR